jgi:hypothetical protein
MSAITSMTELMGESERLREQVTRLTAKLAERTNQLAALTAERDEAVRLSRYAVYEALLHSGHTVVEYTGNVFRQWRQAIDDAINAEQKLAASQQRGANLKDVLQALYDVQNGCPLPKYEKDWHLAMERAQLYLIPTDRPPARLSNEKIDEIGRHLNSLCENNCGTEARRLLMAALTPTERPPV